MVKTEVSEVSLLSRNPGDDNVQPDTSVIAGGLTGTPQPVEAVSSIKLKNVRQDFIEHPQRPHCVTVIPWATSVRSQIQYHRQAQQARHLRQSLPMRIRISDHAHDV